MFISIFLYFKQKPRPINPLNSWTSNLSVLNHARSSVSMLSVTEDLCHQVLGNITLADWVLNRGTLPVTSSGYLNSKKVIFRTLRTMRKQFPVVPRTTHSCADVLMGKCRQFNLETLSRKKDRGVMTMIMILRSPKNSLE